MRGVFTALRHAISAGKNTVLVTILSHTGSAPRGAGSQMLVGKHGLMAGTVGGGAVEGRAIEEALRLLQEGGGAEIREYPLHPSLKDDIGMVCGGEVTVLLSPVTPAWGDAVEAVEARFRGQTGGTLWLSTKDNSAPIVTDKGAECPADGYFPVNMPASQRVVIFGAGHISRALTPLLRMVDFEVTVFDDRPEFAVKEAFPHAETVLCGSYDTIEELLPLKDDDFIVVLTSGHSNDFQVLEQVLRRDLLQSTPLNLKFFLRYLILFLLFPGMVFGFKVGLGITLGFCAVLVGILFLGSEAASALAIYSWLSCGLLVLLFVTIVLVRKAWQERELRRSYRPSTPGLRHAQRAPQNHPLRWHQSNTEGFVAAHLVLQAPLRGVYAVLVTLKNYEGAQLITQGRQGTSLVYAGGGKGEDFNALVLYRLEAGVHELIWAIPTGNAPEANVTLLNQI